MTKSTEIHQNQQPQVTEIRVKPNQDAQNDLGGHETQSEIQKAGPKGPSVKPVAQRQVQQPIAEHHGAEVEGNAKQVKNARRWKVIEIRPMPKVNSKYIAANPPPAAQIST
eukprot:CAMPEP_0174280864 /NCGR_PEP_ID=MMETSP0809-20121228/1188_1 /TAXON_ID=73025 ORGANISM="Eutreptiella gymnastica-like, Strain CCMP1594" /NCGR_SAMPLE_ID=MMETSP0809 /ASSEMBLY_ACC=CAM_ASM_000658 /LENGTH=110 /DNA_ID=CAMNT_0015374031 /DNA_START=90 /DNA_END=419 /DNA_ORIENTATION=-